MAPGSTTVSAGRTITERVQPQRYQVTDENKNAQKNDPPHAVLLIMNHPQQATFGTCPGLVPNVPGFTAHGRCLLGHYRLPVHLRIGGRSPLAR